MQRARWVVAAGLASMIGCVSVGEPLLPGVDRASAAHAAPSTSLRTAPSASASALSAAPRASVAPQVSAAAPAEPARTVTPAPITEAELTRLAEWRRARPHAANRDVFPSVLRVVGPVPHEVFVRILRSREPALRGCFYEALKRDFALTGRYSLRVVIDERGAPVSVEQPAGRTTLARPELERCLERAFLAGGFPQPSGAQVTVLLELILQLDVEQR